MLTAAPKTASFNLSSRKSETMVHRKRERERERMYSSYKRQNDENTLLIEVDDVNVTENPKSAIDVSCTENVI
jgi:uncharacterized protein YegJ (DUF2314 family)